MADRKNDRIPSTEQWKRRARDILASLDKEEAPSRPVPRIERVDPNVRMEPIVMPEKNVLTDPDSWLNRGLMSLGSNAVDAVFGEESGNPLVDYGVANVPGVGAASILAAGGMPGLVDVTGLGAIKNGKRLVKPVKEFILRNAGEEGLRAVDNYIDKFPKVDKLSMADAEYLLTSGKLGKRFDVSFPRQEELISMTDQGMETSMERMRNQFLEAGASDKDMKAISEMFDDMLYRYNSALDKGDLLTAFGVQDTYHSIMGTMEKMYDGVPSNKLREFYNSPKYNEFWKKTMNGLSRNASDINHSLLSSAKPEGEEGTRLLNEYFGIQKHPMQDFDKIEAAQLRRDAQNAEKAAKKAAKQPQPQVTPEPVPDEPAGTLVEIPTEPGGTIVEIPSEQVPARGGPNKWRENGWKSEEHPLSGGLTYDELVGKGATEDDRRASFVLDSLMNEAVGRLYSTGAKWGADGKFYKKGNVPAGVKTVEPSYADYRHKGTNYDAVRLKLARDLQENAISGNMPITAKAVLEQAYNKRSGNRIPGARVLKLNGMDTYETLFRPRVKDRLKELEEYYNIDFMR